MTARKDHRDFEERSDEVRLPTIDYLALSNPREAFESEENAAIGSQLFEHSPEIEAEGVSH